MSRRTAAALVVLWGAVGTGAAAQPPAGAPARLVFDFESGTYDGWTRTGEAFGAAPATGDRAGQNAVAGFAGRHLANSWGANGDGDTGTCTSPEFELTHGWLRFRIGGGDRGAHLGARLVVDGVVRFTAAGEDSETMSLRQWDVRRFRGRKAKLVLVDEWTEGWGHVLLDHVELMDEPEGPACTIGQWRRIYDPSQGNGDGRWGWNDHCFVHAGNVWHLYGIEFREPGTPDTDGQWFGHAVARALDAPTFVKTERALPADHASGEIRVWAPHVVRHAGRYHMFWCGCTPDMTAYRIQHAVSDDGNTWIRNPKNPVLVDGFQGRDPMLVRIGDEWVMYYCATVPPGGGHHTVNFALSDDLVTWRKGGVAFRHAARGTEFGPTESPFVVERGGWYYLFIGPHPTYVGTDVYRSRDPFNFALDQKVAHLHAHATEIVQDGEGGWWASHAGGGMGGVHLAPLYWSDGVDE